MTKTGFIAIVGRPNVGKSTLLNAVLGEKVSIVSSKPQTTRNRITGIFTDGENQFVFLDTPGMLRPKNKLGDYMVKAISSAMVDVDAAILVVDASKAPSEIEETILKRLKSQKTPVILAINKTDTVNAARVAECIMTYTEMADFAAVIPMAAAKGEGVRFVTEEAAKLLHEGDWFFDEDMITDQPERQLAAEIIREKLLRTLNDEIPHGTAVVIEAWEEKSTLIKIRAEIFCEKESHKGIIIGKKGAALKKVGTWAREDMEAFFGVQVHLDLWVKVKENWRDNVGLLNTFGFKEE
ncbi:MAG: GTPase Era [Ruminococcaceae bacterium]|nr:GTPase Era [Oscillospiraceae bacterium]